MDLQHWVNDGLMVFFFFLDRDGGPPRAVDGRARPAQPADRPGPRRDRGARPSGADLLAIQRRRGRRRSGGASRWPPTRRSCWGRWPSSAGSCPIQLRVFLLSLSVVDDIGALSRDRDLLLRRRSTRSPSASPASASSLHRAVPAAGVARAGLLRRRRRSCGWRCTSPASTPRSAASSWACWSAPTPRGARRWSGPDPSPARSGSRPSPASPAQAKLSVERAVSPNERIGAVLVPWSSYLVVPVFALANAGVRIDGEPAGPGAQLADHPRRLRRPRRRQAARRGGGRHARRPAAARLAAAGRQSRQRLGGRGADRAGLHRLPLRHRPRLRRRARCGRRRRSASSRPPWSPRRSARCSSGSWAGGGSAAPRPTRLDPPVDPAVDHLRGPVDAPLTLVEFGDMECPFCGRATGVVGGAARPVRRRAALRLPPPAAVRRAPARRSSPPRPSRRPAPRAPSGPCTTACSPTRTSSRAPTCSTTRPPSGSTSSGSPASWATARYGAARAGRRRRGRGQRRRAAPPPSSSTACGTRAPPPPTRWPPRSCAPIRGARRPNVRLPGPSRRAARSAARRPWSPPARLPAVAGLEETPDEYGASPRLTDRQLGVLRRAGRRRATASGDVLVQGGSPEWDFVVVLEGTVAVVEDGLRPDAVDGDAARRGWSPWSARGGSSAA